MRSDPTFWILARASGLLAYALLTSSVLAGIVLKARPFGAALKAAVVADLHRFLALLGLGFIALHASRARPRQHGPHLRRSSLRARPRPVPAAVVVIRGTGRRTHAPRVRLVRAQAPHRRPSLETPALAHVRSLRARHRPRPRGRNRRRQAVGARALRRGRRRGHRRGRLASIRPRNQRRQHSCTG